MADRFESEGGRATGEDADKARDHKLNAALALYADPQDTVNPRLLAARVLEECEQARWWSGWGAALVPVLACLILAVVVALHWVERSSARNRGAGGASLGADLHAKPGGSYQADTLHPVVVSGLKGRARSATPRTSLADVGGARLPKLDQFPAPSPLTSEEALLLAVATYGDGATQRAVTQTAKPAEPLHIAELRIAPLDTEFSSTSTPLQGAHHAERP